MKTVFLLVSAVPFILSAIPCTCLMYPLEYYLEEELIFVGKVLSVSDTIEYNPEHSYTEHLRNGGYSASVLITEKLKIGDLKADTLSFTSDGSNCDPFYKLNETYLFFAEQKEEGLYEMINCTPWGKIEETADEVEELRTLLKK